MRIFTKILLLIAMVAFTFTMDAQNRRYLDQVFSDVEEVPGTLANAKGVNYTILGFLATQGQAHTLPQPLIANMYYPKGDTATNRPLIMFIHTGNFFPYPANGSCSGTLRDSSNVEIAKRLAKMGYVVAVVDYRLGWNPLHQVEQIRRYFLINAAYRGVQDMNTYGRYFKRSVAELGNPHGIDPDKIVLWGQGTGGYLSLATSYLKTYPEIFATDNPTKFLLTPPVAPANIPMVLEQYNGNINADGPVTTVDATYAALSQFHVGDTLCVPNHVGYTAKFALCVNTGGALGDSSWLNQGEIPLISFHVDTDPLAPVDTDVLNVPTATGPQPVVEVSGSRDLARRVDRFGNDDIFNTIPAGFDPYGQYNKSGHLGYYEFRGTPDDSSAPWEWAAGDNPPSKCNTNAGSAKIYIDTIVGYFAPRACLALGLNCFTSSTKDLTDAQVGLVLSPNPATDVLNLSVAQDAPIKAIALHDISGRMLMNINDINSTHYTLKRNQIQNGIYIIRLQFEKGVISKKVVFD
ncbi:MAG TPA: T9SS type A sorting domain-containing protein [Saprospiraceae bacterium]|nr:T9SS type A sorting domain-containing protein [Saprospiraceae bacterium]HRO07967.1 T9SS type A sorting domain-containing protein [Saprospiraceae bacterium]HRP41462.1 T9SS type A sorting domain-containing protein [Saprospiraceae bacterium]